MTTLVETAALTKRFSEGPAVDDWIAAIPEGTIGRVGPTEALECASRLQ